MVLDLSLPSLQALLAARTAALSEPLALYAAAARDLRGAAPARASFIEAQCRGEEAADLFDLYREAWDVPRFDEVVLNAGDFRRGFLWTFRDFTTSWADGAAREWFCTAPEAQFARRLELWSGAEGDERCTATLEGSYAELVRRLFEGGALEALLSPVFGAAEFAAHRERLGETDPGLRARLTGLAIRRGS